MAEDINLLPEQGIENKDKVRQRKLLKNVSTAVLAAAILLLVVVGAAKLVLEQQIGSVQKVSIGHQQHIQAMKDEEGVYRSLATKLTDLTAFFSQQKHYSTVLNTISATLPSSVKLTDLIVLPTQQATLTGSAGSYADVAGLYNKLRQAGPAGSTAAGAYFSSPLLTSINRNDQSGDISFTMKVTLSPKLLAIQPGS